MVPLVHLTPTCLKPWVQGEPHWFGFPSAKGSCAEGRERPVCFPRLTGIPYGFPAVRHSEWLTPCPAQSIGVPAPVHGSPEISSRAIC